MSTHLPARISRPFFRPCIFQRPYARPFSTTLARPGRGGKSNKKKRIDPVQTEAAARQQGRKGKASSTIYEEQLKDERNLPDDIGLLPGTFIRSQPAKVWSTVSLTRPNTWKAFVWYHWKFVVSKAKAWLLLWRFRKIAANRPSLHFWDEKPMRVTAEEKYKHLYQSFAHGDAQAISQLCVSSVSQKFSDRIAARPRGLKMVWKANGVRSTVMSNRGLLLGLAGYENTGVQQMVFKITSQSQSLDLQGGTQKQGHNVVEYLVLQRQVLRGAFKDWIVWGFANEWLPETIEEDAEHERQVNAYQAETV
ncbi:hypothetical protein CC80DRAFT_591642 [Byssothecium circinans]|uniref:Tim44-like domain-containing protein n=1 Tax=Byssothecium circinans TaxID=147558 RepID=A0A6A5U266_9PLEO|nr:hypothetical protein CC80DRAFT_591642 [Byssothecium circinans]